MGWKHRPCVGAASAHFLLGWQGDVAMMGRCHVIAGARCGKISCFWSHGQKALRSWVSATAASCLKWEESSGACFHGGNVGAMGIAALADHCHQCQVRLSLRLELGTMIISFKDRLLVCFKQTWEQTLKMFTISCIREVS